MGIPDYLWIKTKYGSNKWRAIFVFEKYTWCKDNWFRRINCHFFTCVIFYTQDFFLRKGVRVQDVLYILNSPPACLFSRRIFFILLSTMWGITRTGFFSLFLSVCVFITSRYHCNAAYSLNTHEMLRACPNDLDFQWNWSVLVGVKNGKSQAHSHKPQQHYWSIVCFILLCYMTPLSNMMRWWFQCL